MKWEHLLVLMQIGIIIWSFVLIDNGLFRGVVILWAVSVIIFCVRNILKEENE